ncbi:MAG: hypothetical protein K2N18_03610 [Clostridia bacterium]|nr:hypothetical protein [Clostridia bacterium]
MNLRQNATLKRFCAVLTAVLLCGVLCFLFTACNTSKYLETVDGTYLIGYGNYAGRDKGKAYVGTLTYDGEHNEFTIPDEYKGRKITTLGGYHGTGSPCPFGIDITVALSEYKGYIKIIVDDDPNAKHIPIEFTVRLGRNVSEIANSHEKCYYQATNSEGKNVLTYVVYHFAVDENNPVYYSEDGKLYYRKDGSLVDEFFYE